MRAFAQVICMLADICNPTTHSLGEKHLLAGLSRLQISNTLSQWAAHVTVCEAGCATLKVNWVH
jgi:hypothetical protein